MLLENKNRKIEAWPCWDHCSNVTTGQRIFDVVFATVGLGLYAPFFPIAALLILIEDGRPVFSMVLLSNPPFPSTALYTCGGMTIITALLFPWSHKRRIQLLLLLFGFSLVVATVTIRAVSVSAGNKVRYSTISAEETKSSAPMSARLLSERDVALSGARVLVAGGHFAPREATGLVDNLRAAYGEMIGEEGEFASPLIPGLGESGFDSELLIFKTERNIQPKGAVIFLHGFAGNFSLPCWIFSRAAQKLDLETVCPTVGWRGNWWSKRGRRIVDQTIRKLRGQGIRKIFLAGLSNGGVGLSLILPQFTQQVSGAILISGCSAKASAARIPALIVHGRGDSMASAATCRRYASRSGKTVRYKELDGDHFVFLKKRRQAIRIIRRWLARRL